MRCIYNLSVYVIIHSYIQDEITCHHHDGSNVASGEILFRHQTTPQHFRYGGKPPMRKLGIRKNHPTIFDTTHIQTVVCIISYAMCSARRALSRQKHTYYILHNKQYTCKGMRWMMAFMAIWGVGVNLVGGWSS